MTLAEKFKLFLDWAPTLAALGNVVQAEPGAERVRAFIQVLDDVTERTHNKVDDEAIDLLHEVAMTPQGGALIDWASDKILALFEDDNDNN